MIFWILVAMFFITVAVFVGFLVKYMKDEDLEKFADQMYEKKMKEFKKTRNQDITDI
jgi:hypothetical protein